jgi:hypothetical protein
MRCRYVLLAVASTLALGAAAVAPAAAQASARSGAVVQAQAPAVSPASVPMTVCAQSGSGYCLNRSQCHTGNGTSVLVWANDHDNCEDFQGIVLGHMCNKGFVTRTCPFTVGSGLNDRYVGQPIVLFQAYNEANECLATNGGGQGILGACPSFSGTGGANGTIFVWTAYGPNPNYVINRYWSDYNYSIGVQRSLLDVQPRIAGPVGPAL